MSTLPDGDWPPSLGRQYTRLAMIEQEERLPGAELVATMERDYIHGNIDNIVKRKKAIELPEVFLITEGSSQQLKILMDGAPGVGKSTLSRKICKDWASGELLQQYHLVILLPLRQKSIREATSIENLIEADDPDLKQQVVQHIQRTSGEHVLLIVDGYDELSYKHRIQNSLFLNIIQVNKFPKCSVLVTSRPYASNYLQQLQSVNRHVEVLGFTEKQIEHCIMKSIPDKLKATELVQALKERQDIASLCYIPLNCAIVLYVYEKQQCALPHSLTRIYETFIVNAVKRHAKIIGKDPGSIRKFHTLANMSDPLQKQLSALTKLAYDGLVADKMVFSIDDLESAFPDCSDLECRLLGLMTAFKEFTTTGEELSFQFLHLTIQEFLAARWAAFQLSADELLKFFQDHLKEERYRMVLLFLAGISELSFPFADYFFRDKFNFEESSHTRRKKVVDYFLFLSHLIYESQNLSLFHNLGCAIVEAKLSAKGYSISSFDCLVLAHFLAWCDCSLKSLDLSYCGLTSQLLEMAHRVNLEHRGATRVEEVDLSCNPEIIAKLSLLSKLPIFKHTRVFKAYGLQSPKRVVDLLCFLNMRHLTTLECSVKGRRIWLALSKFECKNENIDSQNASEIFGFLENNTSLGELDLSWNGQLAEDDSEAVGCAIERMLTMNTALKVLNLGGCKLTDEIIACFSNGLAHNYSMRKVVLHSIQVGSTGAVSIFRSLEHNTSLEELDLSNNSQLAESDIEAVGCAIERMLNVNVTLKVLNLNGCNITDPIVKHTLTGLAKNTSLVTLNMGSPKLSGSCAVSLIQQMTTHPTLNITVVNVGEVNVLGVGRVKMDRGTITWCVISDLIPENCVEFFRALNNSGLKVSKLNVQDLTDQTAEHFAVGLAESQCVSALRLNHGFWERKSITSAGAVSIFRSLEHNTSLEELDLSENSQLAEGDSEAVGCAIERMLTMNTALKVLNLGGCKLTDEIIACFSNGLAHNYSMRKVVLHSIQVGSTGAVSIFRSLEHNTSLEELDLSNNSQLAESDIEAVGCAIERMLNVNVTLKVLNLNGCNITDPIVKHTLTGLAKNTSLVTLNMGSPKLSGSCAVSLIQQMTTHPTLNITVVNVGEVNVLGVGRVKMDRGTITWCVISDLIPENCVEFFRALNNSGLKVSKLNVQDLTDQTAEHFAVGLAESQCVSALRLNHGFWERKSITSAGAVSIFRSLEHNTSLEELDLSENSQLAEGDSEAVGCAIERMLNVNRTLKVLDLSGCNVSDPIVKHILTGLTKNTSLVTLNMISSKLSGSCAVSLFQHMTTHPTLSRVHVGEVNVLGVGRVKMDRGTIIQCVVGDLIPENCVEFFKALNDSGLKVLNWNVQDLTDQTAEHFAVGLAESQCVSALRLNHGFWERKSITSAGAVSIFRSLEHNTSLEELDLSENSQLAEGDSEAVGCAIERMLNVNRTLKVLNLSDCNVTDPIVKHILTGLTKKTSHVTLNMGSPKLSGSCAVSLFQHMTTHPTLSITVGEVNVLGFGRVKMYNGGLWCVMGDLIPEKCVEFFRALNDSCLKVSKLNVQDLTDQTAEHFAVGLAESQSVQALKLKHCSICTASSVSIFRSLEHNTSLEELDVSGNSQLAEGDSEAVGCAIERTLNVNRSLKVLNLSECRLDTAVANYIAAALAHNDSLIELNIERNCYITSEMWVHVFKALCNNTALKKLEMNVNNVRMEGSVALAGMLSCNKSLTEVSLSDCLIPDAGLREIARGLLHNTSLKRLNFSNNKLGVEGSVALAEMLSYNKSLTELNLQWCDIPMDGLTEIERGLLQNTTLQTLTLWPSQQITFLEAEIERLKKCGNFTPQSSSKLEIKTKNDWA